MSMLTNTMFEGIKTAMSDAKSTGNQAFKDILKMEKGKTYEVRLVPNAKSPKDTFFHYFTHGWESFATGQYVSAMSPQTFGGKDPIGEYRYKIFRTGSPQEKERSEAIYRKEQWMVNVYVVSDPTTPENVGKVKILRYGKQLDKIINSAIDGVDADQFGMRVFDFSENGCNLRINVEEQGGYPNYSTSKFLMPTKLNVDIENVYNSIHDLSSIQPLKSYEELQAMLDEHFHCITTSNVSSRQDEDEGEDDIPMDFSSNSTSRVSESSDEVDPLDDPIVRGLLDGINEE